MTVKIPSIANQQKEIKHKFYNSNTRMQTRQFKLILLKQDPKATSIKPKYLKKRHAKKIH